VFAEAGVTPLPDDVAASAAAGVDLSLNPHLLISSELRYAWGKGSLDVDFVGFDQLDLSGFQLTFGVGVRL
jgi:hypothetical protein